MMGIPVHAATRGAGWQCNTQKVHALIVRPPPPPLLMPAAAPAPILCVTV